MVKVSRTLLVSLVSLMNSMMFICCPKPHPELLKSLYLHPTKEYISLRTVNCREAISG